MSLLGHIGNLYMRVLIILLVVGLGYAAYGAAGYMYKLLGLKKENGWFFQTDWLKFAVLSLTGVILLLILQNIITPNNRIPFTPSGFQTIPFYQNSFLPPTETFKSWPTNLPPPLTGNGQAHASHHGNP